MNQASQHSADSLAAPNTMATVNGVQDSVVVGDLMGTAEVAALLGLSKGRITQLLHEGRMPAPVANLKATPVWEGEAIRQFARIRETDPGPVPGWKKDPDLNGEPI